MPLLLIVAPPWRSFVRNTREGGFLLAGSLGQSRRQGNSAQGIGLLHQKIDMLREQGPV
jgi:hypothetical protein